jgi:glycosyltransferase involved in cell wall biosynthesis
LNPATLARAPDGQPYGCRVLVLSAHFENLDRRIVAEANTLAASGRSVSLVSVPIKEPNDAIDGRVRLMAMPSQAGSLASRLKAAVRKTVQMCGEPARALWFAWPAGKAARSLAAQLTDMARPGPYDVVHCHDLNTLAAGAGMRAELWPNAKLVYDSHELFPFQKTSPSYRRYWLNVERQHIRKADLVITVNESIAEEMARIHGIPKPEVLYNSCEVPRVPWDLSAENFRGHFGAQGDMPTVLFHGTLPGDRNLDNLVSSFGALRGKARLFVLGEGEVKPRLQRLVSRGGLDNVFFGPAVPQNHLLSYVRHADLGVIPYSAREGLNNLYCTPNKLFEYIEAGVPVCANDLPELRKLLLGHGAGRVYSMETAPQIAAALEDCLALRRAGEFTAERMTRARETFSWESQARKLLAFYNALGV